MMLLLSALFWFHRMLRPAGEWAECVSAPAAACPAMPAFIAATAADATNTNRNIFDPFGVARRSSLSGSKKDLTPGGQTTP
jgi:hypothetical protein